MENKLNHRKYKLKYTVTPKSRNKKWRKLQKEFDKKGNTSDISKH